MSVGENYVKLDHRINIVSEITSVTKCFIQIDLASGQIISMDKEKSNERSFDTRGYNSQETYLVFISLDLKCR